VAYLESSLAALAARVGGGDSCEGGDGPPTLAANAAVGRVTAERAEAKVDALAARLAAVAAAAGGGGGVVVVGGAAAARRSAPPPRPRTAAAAALPAPAGRGNGHRRKAAAATTPPPPAAAAAGQPDDDPGATACAAVAALVRPGRAAPSPSTTAHRLAHLMTAGRVPADCVLGALEAAVARCALGGEDDGDDGDGGVGLASLIPPPSATSPARSAWEAAWLTPAARARGALDALAQTAAALDSAAAAAAAAAATTSTPPASTPRRRLGGALRARLAGAAYGGAAGDGWFTGEAAAAAGVAARLARLAAGGRDGPACSSSSPGRDETVGLVLDALASRMPAAGGVPGLGEGAIAVATAVVLAWPGALGLGDGGEEERGGAAAALPPTTPAVGAPSPPAPPPPPPPADPAVRVILAILQDGAAQAVAATGPGSGGLDAAAGAALLEAAAARGWWGLRTGRAAPAATSASTPTPWPALTSVTPALLSALAEAITAAAGPSAHHTPPPRFLWVAAGMAGLALGPAWAASTLLDGCLGPAARAAGARGGGGGGGGEGDGLGVVAGLTVRTAAQLAAAFKGGGGEAAARIEAWARGG